MTIELLGLIISTITALIGLAIAALQWRGKVRADERAKEDAERRLAESKMQAQRDEIERNRHQAIVDRLDRIETRQEETKDEIAALHKRDNELAVELERRTGRIEGRLGLHGRPDKDGGTKQG